MLKLLVRVGLFSKLVTVGLLLSIALLANWASAFGATAPDSTLYTTYSLIGTDLEWVVCGSIGTAEGCFSSGSIGPFGKVGAMIEGNPSVNTSTNTVNRAVYILDVASGSAGNGVTLDVYQKADIVTSSFDTTTFTLLKTVSLSLIGGSTAVGLMAANNGYLFAGTTLSTNAEEITKSNLAVSEVPGFTPPVSLSSITADLSGHVSVTFGSNSGGESGFYLYGPTGALQEDGGGSEFLLSTVEGISGSELQ